MTTVVCAKLASLGAYQLAAKLIEFAHRHQDVAKWVCDVATSPSDGGDSGDGGDGAVDDDDPKDRDEKATPTSAASVVVVVSQQPWCVNTQLYLVSSGRIATASEMTIAHHKEVVCDNTRRGIYERRMLALASAFADNSYPLAASIVYRAVVASILRRDNPLAYAKASDCLITLKVLTHAVKNWQGVERHHMFLAALRQRHRGKTEFWRAYAQKVGIRLEHGGARA